MCNNNVDADPILTRRSPSSKSMNKLVSGVLLLFLLLSTAAATGNGEMKQSNKCGDGVRDEGEDCDDGNSKGDEG